MKRSAKKASRRRHFKLNVKKLPWQGGRLRRRRVPPRLPCDVKLSRSGEKQVASGRHRGSIWPVESHPGESARQPLPGMPVNLVKLGNLGNLVNLVNLVTQP